MKYVVDIKDTSYGVVEVDACSKEEAEEMASGLWYEGKVEWVDCDLDVDARKAERNQGDGKYGKRS